MKTSDKGVALIKELEGLRLKAYRCPAGVLTIGYGSTLHVGPNDEITPAQAEAKLREDLKRFEKRVNKALQTDDQNVFDGAVSFDYNTGAIFEATWVHLYNAGGIDTVKVAEWFLKWDKIKVGGVLRPSEGLRNRREKEIDHMWGAYVQWIVPPRKPRRSLGAWIKSLFGR